MKISLPPDPNPTSIKNTTSTAGPSKPVFPLPSKAELEQIVRPALKLLGGPEGNRVNQILAQARQLGLSEEELLALERSLRLHPGQSLGEELQVVERLLNTRHPENALRCYMTALPYRESHPHRVTPAVAEALGHAGADNYVLPPAMAKRGAEALAHTTDKAYGMIQKYLDPLQSGLWTRVTAVARVSTSADEFLSSDPADAEGAARSIQEWFKNQK